MYFGTENPFGIDAHTAPDSQIHRPATRRTRKISMQLPPAPRLTDLVKKLALS